MHPFTTAWHADSASWRLRACQPHSSNAACSRHLLKQVLFHRTHVHLACVQRTQANSVHRTHVHSLCSRTGHMLSLPTGQMSILCARHMFSVQTGHVFSLSSGHLFSLSTGHMCTGLVLAAKQALPSDSYILDCCRNHNAPAIHADFSHVPRLADAAYVGNSLMAWTYQLGDGTNGTTLPPSRPWYP